MQGNANEPKSWHVQSSRKKSTAAEEEDILLSQNMRDVLHACEVDADDASADMGEEEDGGGNCNELLDELELRQLSILQRMAQKGADPTHIREKVRRLGRTADLEGGDGSTRHRQSKLKNMRRSMKRSDEGHMSGSGHRSWVEVDEVGCPTGVRRPDWLTRLRGYSRDLDWSVDNFKEHPRPLLMAIKDKMAAQFEYRGGLGDVPEEVFFQILRQQMRTRRSNMKKIIESGGTLPPYMKKAHVDNFKRLIAREDKIAEACRMKAARQTVQTLSYSGRSEGEVRSRLVSNLVWFLQSFLLHVTSHSHITRYMTPCSHITSYMTYRSRIIQNMTSHSYFMSHMTTYSHIVNHMTVNSHFLSMMNKYDFTQSFFGWF